MTCPEEMGGTNGLQSLHLTGFMVLERELLCLQKQLNILQWDVIKGFSFNFVCWRLRVYVLHYAHKKLKGFYHDMIVILYHEFV